MSARMRWQRTRMKTLGIFADHCVFMRSIYLHSKTLFEHSSVEERERMSRIANVFFGDLNRVLIEYMILQVCKITDPARDFRNNDNHTTALLLSHYEFAAEPQKAQQLRDLQTRLQAFRNRLLPARNKLISHADRAAILGRASLGGVPDNAWDEFWIDLQDFVGIIYEKAVGTPIEINGCGGLSDADSLLKVLKQSDCFEQLLHGNDSDLTHKCVDLMLGRA